ncbi:hypothetical protein HYH03_018771 [Edaphochlamys debaryana]|uniref:cysteine--tRNA ligase n=1 Tax=Edaphochlamys debaryana TaxID=47281 RepID=A0A835XH70_9CHLO|nr:hypothetical protein HYH03_018771 [Edaphochlamys debaryana]|eukprot:KAG2482286.1 hypothetical protein HYH03_018771 [Edaphochlamys debaryana]
MALKSLSQRRQSSAWAPFSGRRPTSVVARPCAQAQAVQAASPAVAAPAATSPLSQAALRERVSLYNTMSRAKEPFRPRLPDGPVSMYVCGVTVYDFSHIGHARVYVAFDVLLRFLTRACGWPVTYVRNYTDIDDKIIARAQQNGEEPAALTERFIAAFEEDMAALNCLRPSLEPRATAYVGAMISTIQSIIANGHAYPVEGGDVFFDVASLPGYGRLSGRQQEDNRAGERVAVDGRKRSAADFALWKAAKAGEPSWPSPWGPGRPGWHIECSAMIAELMGPVIDIHGGGQDLVFPHHENELAQSQAACGCGHRHGPHEPHGQPSSSAPSPSGDASGSPSASPPAGDFVRYWLHNGFVNVDSEKMSKSLGNFFTIRDVLARYHPLALRWFLVGAQYRAPLNYSDKGLEEASGRLYYVVQARADVAAALLAAGADGERALAEAEAALAPSSSAAAAAAPAAPAAPAAKGKGKGAAPAGPSPGAALLAEALQALADDLNTPAAVGSLSGPLRAINDLLTTKAGRKRPDRLSVLAELHVAMGRVMDLLGMEAPGAGAGAAAAGGEGAAGAAAGGSLAGSLAALEQLLAELRALALVRLGLTEEAVQAAIRERAEARAAKDFARSDAIRLDLDSKGVLLLDTPQGTTWRPGSAAAAE